MCQSPYYGTSPASYIGCVVGCLLLPYPSLLCLPIPPSELFKLDSWHLSRF